MIAARNAQDADLRLAFRVDKRLWCAYLARPDTMDGATLIGSIAMSAITDNEPLKQKFIEFMQGVALTVIKRTMGEEGSFDRAELRPAPEIERPPGFWTNETSGVLRPVVEVYLTGGKMDAVQISIMRDYLSQWINAPGFLGPIVEQLRLDVERLYSRQEIAAWLDRALKAGIDPL